MSTQESNAGTKANLAAFGLLFSAVALAALAFLTNARRAESNSAPPTQMRVKSWRTYAATGHRIGDATAPVVITEFSDFVCPFCARAQATLNAVVTKYHGQVAIAFHHWPQPALHPQAERAALAAECAGDQGEFRSYHDALFATQDSIGVRSWAAFARDVHVRDTVAFNHCMTSMRHANDIASDAKIAERLGGQGTPFFLVNDEAVFGARPIETFEALIDKKLAALRQK